MTITRAQMQTQMRGDKMKKTKKKAGGGMIGGALGALMSGDIRGALPGVLGVMADKKIKKDRDSASADGQSNMSSRSSSARGMSTPTSSAKKMKSGGKVRGDGIARKGKTKGRMC